MIVRVATPEDIPVIARLEERLFAADAWSLPTVVAEISGGDRFAVVAVEGDHLLGYAVTMRSADVVDLQRIGVHPAHQRHGVARALLGRSVLQARETGADAMLLEVSVGSEPGLAFYAAAGFEGIDRRRRYYRDGSDALVLRLPLNTGCGGRSGERGGEGDTDG